jgi:hypothetical protein
MIRISKHRQFDPETGKWIEGDVIVTKHSSLRKLARAMRRGKLPAEMQGVIETAMERAGKRIAAYANSSPLKRTYRTDARWAKTQSSRKSRKRSAAPSSEQTQQCEPRACASSSVTSH